MSPTPVARGACPTGTASVLGLTTPGLATSHYQRHLPEQTFLYQIIEQHSPAFSSHLAEQGAANPPFPLRIYQITKNHQVLLT